MGEADGTGKVFFFKIRVWTLARRLAAGCFVCSLPEVQFFSEDGAPKNPVISIIGPNNSTKIGVKKKLVAY